MSWAYRHLIRPMLFRHDAEHIHEFTLRRLGQVARHRALRSAVGVLYGSPPLPVERFGLRFPNPVGLAAGMDKPGEAVPVWPALGFGFSELGAVTWLAQPGNPPPRLFRIIPDQAIINRMGFNNAGAQALADRLAAWRAGGQWPAHPVGINLGKSKLTPLAEAPADYAASLRVLWPHADFFVINVSSPNTPDLRRLQDKDALDAILQAMQAVNASQAAARPGAGEGLAPKPILVKVAPDLAYSALDEILELVEPRQIAGLVATNTTISRPEHPRAGLEAVYRETGGLSGVPLRARSTEVIRHLYRQSRGGLPIIGVGGIASAADAWEKVTAGASLLQVYTGMVYEGPGLARAIVRGLRRRLAEAGLDRLDAAVGLAAEPR